MVMQSKQIETQSLPTVVAQTPADNGQTRQVNVKAEKN